MQVIPTTELQKEYSQAEKRIKEVKDTSQWIHIDVLDNVFAEGQTFPLELISKLDFETSNILWDVHLMVNNPVKWLEKCIFVGASRIVGQVEKMDNREEFTKLIKDAGLEAGLGFDIESEVDNIPEETDLVIIMGRKAGFGEYPLDNKTFEKIEKAKEIRSNRNNKFLIAVDGGVTVDNFDKLKEAGVDVIYSGKDYFELLNA